VGQDSVGEIAITDANAFRVALARIHRHFRARIGNDITASQASALARIEQSGPIRLTALSEFEGISAPTMNKVIDALAQRGLVERMPDPLDGRASLLQLCEGGEAMLHEIRTRYTEALRWATNALPERERHIILAAIPILDHLSELLLEEHIAIPK
jgi:DNA-binding MarR family transcriptional regulator